MERTRRPDTVVIANCSGFFGDRLSAPAEMVRGGHIDFLTGDYLAELTMAILFRSRMKNPSLGYVPTFLAQMEQVLGECMDRGVKVVSNAGGLNPRGLAQELERLSQRLGLHPKIACIEGDDLMPDIARLQEEGEDLAHLERGLSLREAKAVPITANAYLGCWGVVKALEMGADIVVGGRIADASLVVGPAAWWFGWAPDDWDRLAGAAVAGHIVECGAQATGGNYSFFDEVPDYRRVGFPLAEIHEDGSFVITKHPKTGGLVSVDTVKAQLLYEIRGPAYLTPDVTAHFDSVSLAQEGPDRVSVRGAKGSPPPDTLKVCINTLAGYRNSVTVVLTGLDVERKARVVTEALFDAIGPADSFQVCDVQLVRSDREDPPTNEQAFAYLRITVIDPDQKKADRVSSAVVELALANIPGFTLTAPPSRATPAVVYWPALVGASRVRQAVVMNGARTEVDAPNRVPSAEPFVPGAVDLPRPPGGPKARVPFGRVFATRSGDKGGDANLGVWARTSDAYAFLRSYLDVGELKKLCTDLAPYEIERYELPNLLALNFYIKGMLGLGAASSVRMDPQAKTLGEYLRARVVEVPESIVPGR
ncbi:MAG TPA: DUF1446 domain-containing protein [Deltaproteobacteria bacterium]|nr:DUF1446 domain-containing protein [Deltaproteobacteria bacterium]